MKSAFLKDAIRKGFETFSNKDKIIIDIALIDAINNNYPIGIWMDEEKSLPNQIASHMDYQDDKIYCLAFTDKERFCKEMKGVLLYVSINDLFNNFLSNKKISGIIFDKFDKEMVLTRDHVEKLLEIAQNVRLNSVKEKDVFDKVFSSAQELEIIDSNIGKDTMILTFLEVAQNVCVDIYRRYDESIKNFPLYMMQAAFYAGIGGAYKWDKNELKGFEFDLLSELSKSCDYFDFDEFVLSEIGLEYKSPEEKALRNKLNKLYVEIYDYITENKQTNDFLVNLNSLFIVCKAIFNLGSIFEATRLGLNDKNKIVGPHIFYYNFRNMVKESAYKFGYIKKPALYYNQEYLRKVEDIVYSLYKEYAMDKDIKINAENIIKGLIIVGVVHGYELVENKKYYSEDMSEIYDEYNRFYNKKIEDDIEDLTEIYLEIWINQISKYIDEPNKDEYAIAGLISIYWLGKTYYEDYKAIK